jgi:hypothetical protein
MVTFSVLFFHGVGQSAGAHGSSVPPSGTALAMQASNVHLCCLALPRYPQRLCRGRRKKSVNTSNRSKPQAIARERSRYAGIVMRQLINGDCSMAWCKALHREQRQDRGVDASLPSSCRIYSIEAECVRLERPGRKVHDIEAPEPRDASTISGTAYSGDVNLIRVNF